MTLGKALGRAPGQGDLAQLHGRRPCRYARVRCAARAPCSETKHGGGRLESASRSRLERMILRAKHDPNGAPVRLG